MFQRLITVYVVKIGVDKNDLFVIPLLKNQQGHKYMFFVHAFCKIFIIFYLYYYLCQVYAQNINTLRYYSFKVLT